MKRRAFAWLSLLMAMLAGCEPPFAGCEPPMDLTDDHAGVPADGGADAGGTCPPGRYVRKTRLFSGPYWRWIGPNDGQAPECPPEPFSGGGGWDWYRDLVAPKECELCTCGLSPGKCELPSELTASTTGCNIAGGMLTSFNAPANWDGKCDTTTHVDPGAASSVWIAPITVTQEACSPVIPELERKAVAYQWNTLGRFCEGWGWNWSQNPDTICIPDDAPAPEGFRLCIIKEVANEMAAQTTECDPEWPMKDILYEGVDDGRVCEECTCGRPTGGLCTAMISLDKDPACTAPVEGLISISSTKPACVDLSPPGQALVSKHATPPTYIPGTCAPIYNKASGTASPSGPVVVCCQ
jgi:hypothetical protein